MPEQIQHIDESILFFIQEHIKNPALNQLMILFTKLGNAGLLWIIIAFILLCLKPYKRCGIALLCAIPISILICDDFLKPIFGRVRPNIKFQEIPILISIRNSPSFPSGHTTMGFAAATTMFHYHKKLGIIGYLLAAIIGFSRLYLFVHYPTDILGGILLGILTAYGIILCLERTYNYHPIDQTKPQTKQRS